jgi:hypothetical protein
MTITNQWPRIKGIAALPSSALQPSETPTSIQPVPRISRYEPKCFCSAPLALLQHCSGRDVGR